jgi:hypothetical protein
MITAITIGTRIECGSRVAVSLIAFKSRSAPGKALETSKSKKN